MCACVCVWVRVCMACAYLWFGAPHILTPCHTYRRTPTPRTKKTVIHPPPTRIPSVKANSPPLDPHPHTARPHTLIRTWTVDLSRLNV